MFLGLNPRSEYAIEVMLELAEKGPQTFVEGCTVAPGGKRATGYYPYCNCTSTRRARDLRACTWNMDS